MPPRQWLKQIQKTIYSPLIGQISPQLFSPFNEGLHSENVLEKFGLRTLNIMNISNIEILKNGGVGVIPTDTVYGLVASAVNPVAIKKVIEIKNRSDGKGFIVLISSVDDLKLFGVTLTETARIFLQKFWPGSVSVILESANPEFDFLKKDGTIAFRLPAKNDLIEILKQTGPLIAPSANPEGQPPAKNIAEAQKYFILPSGALAKLGGQPDFYEDGGELDSAPSTLVKIVGDKVEVLRQGAVKVLND